MQGTVDNRPKQPMLSVCMLEKKQRLASHLNVCGFRTEGKSERERKKIRQKERKKMMKKRETTTECNKSRAQSQGDGGDLQITHLAVTSVSFHH